MAKGEGDGAPKPIGLPGSWSAVPRIDTPPSDILDPIGVPAWREPAGALDALPYVGIGRVRVLRNGAEEELGTCWLAGENTAITAAHVVVRTGRVIAIRVDFPGAPDTPVLDVITPPEFGRATAPYDPWDLAILRLERGHRAFLSFHGSPAGNVRLVGFPFITRAAMMESSGSAVLPDAEVMLHKADSASGHSGGPLLNDAPSASGDAVVGLHIAGFSGNPHEARFPRHNVALQLRPALTTLIAEHVARLG